MWRIALCVLAALLTLPDAACAQVADRGEWHEGRRAARDRAADLPRGNAAVGPTAGRRCAGERAARRRGRRVCDLPSPQRLRRAARASWRFERSPARRCSASGRRDPSTPPRHAVASLLASTDPADASRVAATTARDARIAALSGARQRPPYDDTSVATAIRDGIDMTGRRMNPGMPRYALDDNEMQALTAYLKSLSARFVTGCHRRQGSLRHGDSARRRRGEAPRDARRIAQSISRTETPGCARERGASRQGPLNWAGPTANGCCMSGNCADQAIPGAINWRPITASSRCSR